MGSSGTAWTPHDYWHRDQFLSSTCVHPPLYLKMFGALSLVFFFFPSETKRECLFPALPWAISGTEPPGLVAVASPSDMKIKLPMRLNQKAAWMQSTLDAGHPRRRAP